MASLENNPANQGRLLREALIERIRSARQSGDVLRKGKRVIIATEDVIKRFPPDGIAFGYAEEILRAAGFAIPPRPTREAPGEFVGSEFQFDVNAFSDIDEVKCMVVLRPKGPYDYSYVHQVLTICEYLTL
jgi:hypothetical protein